MKYEITCPGAGAMINQEQMTGILPIDAYATKSVVAEVSREILTNEWKKACSTSYATVKALISHLGNNPGWQQTLLEVLLDDIKKNPRYGLVSEGIYVSHTENDKMEMQFVIKKQQDRRY
jgi:hypothetical protein